MVKELGAESFKIRKQGRKNGDAIRKKASKQTTLSEAPPTKNPSISGCAANSLQLAPFTEPTSMLK